MTVISWNLIQDRATEFASKYQGETYEKGESQSFWSDFLHIFGIDRRRHGAFFEYAIKKTGGKQGFIDMFWPGKLLAEQKSAGRDLAKANLQALDYLQTMPDHDLPQAIVVSDFGNFELRMLESNEVLRFKLSDLPKHVRAFAFLLNQQSRRVAEEDPVNRNAAEAMAALHNQLRDDNYTGHDLELLLVRLVFCMFADDSGIFERDSFRQYLELRTDIDGSDLGPRLVKVFEVLNTPETERQGSLDEELRALRYINGGLFAKNIRTPDFTYKMRDDLLKAMSLDWSQVSPAIFGSMFQGVMDEKQRRNLGAHYTSEKNILRVIKPLFLNELYEEFARIRHIKPKLREFHGKLASLTFLDPACGCGNFLVITYREIRRLEHKVIELQYGRNAGLFETGEHGVVKVNVDQMYGIELEEFPSLIAETALWLTDHQMNVEFSQQSGKTFVRLPLTKKATIVHANALTTDWSTVIPAENLNYILGNPPFIGKKEQSKEQKALMVEIFKGVQGAGVIDFVCAWYIKACLMMKQNASIQTALVSTNSITQGEQASILWTLLLENDICINFAHRTFKWSNDAKGIAAVYCVIVGFSLHATQNNRIFDYTEVKGEPSEIFAKNINPYLVDAPNLIIANRSSQISNMPKMIEGITPLDNGVLSFTPVEKDSLITKEPGAEKWIKQWITGSTFINNKKMYCLWLSDIQPSELRAMPVVMDLVEQVKQFRLNSKSSQKFASTPWLFRETTIPVRYLIIPKTSSENRSYIPIGYAQDAITSSSSLIVESEDRFLFAVLTSRMHMTWTSTVCGRLKSDYRYSAKLVYNNFPFPDATEVQKIEIENLAQTVLEARAQFPEAALADLYDPLTMPPALTKAHTTLDRAVDKLYQPKPFATDTERVGLLFKKYQELNIG